MNIVSLLPSATEILFKLGLGDQVVGVTHECDYPEQARSRQVLTRCAFDSASMSQSEIDETVRRLAREEKSLYEIDDAKLLAANPDLIVTQDLCHVCAITPKEVDRALSGLSKTPQVISLNPRLLEDVFADMMQIAGLTQVDAGGIIRELQSRVKKVLPASTLPNRPTVGCIEWLDPLWRSGHWVPEMVQLAGGRESFAEIGKPSRTVSWEEVLEKDPDFLIFMPCGMDLQKTEFEFDRIRNRYAWGSLTAYRKKQMILVDANSYFSRSGPRLVEGLEILAEILHPESFSGAAPADSYKRL